MLLAYLKASQHLWSLVDFLKRGGSPCVCVNVIGLAGSLGIEPQVVIATLRAFSNAKTLGLTTWRNDLWREVNYSEWAGEGFFYNSHDAGHVRLRLS